MVHHLCQESNVNDILMAASFLGQRFLFTSVFKVSRLDLFPQVSPSMSFDFKAISPLFRLDFMRQVGSYSNHEHSVIPHARSTCAVDRFASLSQFMPICSKHLKPLGLILAMKTSEIWLEMWLLLLGNKYYNSFECTQLTPTFNFV